MSSSEVQPSERSRMRARAMGSSPLTLGPDIFCEETAYFCCIAGSKTKGPEMYILPSVYFHST